MKECLQASALAGACFMSVACLVKKYGGTKVLIVYGGGSVVRSGLLDRVKNSLQEVGIDYAQWESLGFGQTPPHCA